MVLLLNEVDFLHALLPDFLDVFAHLHLLFLLQAEFFELTFDSDLLLSVRPLRLLVGEDPRRGFVLALLYLLQVQIILFDFHELVIQSPPVVLELPLTVLDPLQKEPQVLVFVVYLFLESLDLLQAPRFLLIDAVD